ncbi:hypothetical protein P0136_12270 [Lentisphaerota bacterium ZTH]|nr:hypothetical protein JYG24_10215 [Lentisphaerota bacterium]WET06133.1 hypothetical protein P0136_12270 [Lentisphaerota bacterium ZTH]
MTEKLQGLLEKIRDEGLKKADDEKQQIISAAENSATDIIKKAKAEAVNIRKKAQEDAENLEQRARTAVSQASRDIILKLKSELQKRLENIIRDTSDAAMTPEFMGQLIKEMAIKFVSASEDGQTLEVLVAAKDRDQLVKLLSGSLAKSFKTEPQVFPDDEIGGGLKVGFKGKDLFFDFTDDAVTDLVCGYVSPRLAEILKKRK